MHSLVANSGRLAFIPVGRIMTAWTRGCARSGFDGVELHNLDSHTRSHWLLTRSQAVAYARLLVSAAHRAGRSEEPLGLQRMARRLRLRSG